MCLVEEVKMTPPPSLATVLKSVLPTKEKDILPDAFDQLYLHLVSVRTEDQILKNSA